MNVFPGQRLCFCSLVVVLLNRYWPLIDDAIRNAAFEKKVKIQMLISCGKASDPAMLPFLKSLAALDSHEHGISIQIVRVSPITFLVLTLFFKNFFCSLEIVHCAWGQPD